MDIQLSHWFSFPARLQQKTRLDSKEPQLSQKKFFYKVWKELEEHAEHKEEEEEEEKSFVS